MKEKVSKEGYGMSLVDFDSKLSEKNAESNTADLRGLFIQVMNSYLSAKKQSFANHPIANLVRNSFREEIYKTEFITSDKFAVTGSPGQGNWASIPWIGIFNKSRLHRIKEYSWKE